MQKVHNSHDAAQARSVTAQKGRHAGDGLYDIDCAIVS
jgi:hypothetical protein